MAVCQNLVPLVNIKIAGKWMFIPLKMVLIGIDPYPYPNYHTPDFRPRISPVPRPSAAAASAARSSPRAPATPSAAAAWWRRRRRRRAPQGAGSNGGDGSWGTNGMKTVGKLWENHGKSGEKWMKSTKWNEVHMIWKWFGKNLGNKLKKTWVGVG